MCAERIDGAASCWQYTLTAAQIDWAGNQASKRIRRNLRIGGL